MRLAAFLLGCSAMKTRILSLLAAGLFVSSVMACHRHARPSEGPVQKTKEVVKDVGHDVKETGKDIKNDIKK